MSGGFCEKHGPFDPPHTVCPYCKIDNEQRRAYGPPAAPPAPGTGFVRETVEPSVAEDALIDAADVTSVDDLDEPGGLTEVAPKATEERPGDSLEPDAAADAVEEDATPIVGWLVVKLPKERRGEILRIGANQSIGREADIRWDDPRLSRQHARLTLEPPAESPEAAPVFHLWPFAPTNPVYINGQEIRGATPLHENDEIRLGDTLFVFKVLTD